jgi:flagellar motor switch/type III secretory pathway protein FliN
MMVVAITMSAAAGQETKEAPKSGNERDLNQAGQATTHPDLKQQREHFDQAVHETESSTAFCEQRGRFERDLAQLKTLPWFLVLTDRPDVSKSLGEASQVFMDLETSLEVQVGRKQAQRQAKELEASPDAQIQKRQFQEEMKRLETAPGLQEQKEKVERDLKAFQRSQPGQ